VLASGPVKEVFTLENLEETFGGVLRFHILGGHDLHDDDDSREVTVVTDDERPFVLYGENEQRSHDSSGKTPP
jgi:manganese/iron transport system ATP-binding protein